MGEDRAHARHLLQNPNTMRTLLFTLALCVWLPSAASQPRFPIEGRVASLREALASRDAGPLLPLLADSCRIERQYTGQRGRAVLRAVLAQLPATDSLTLAEVADDGDGIRAELLRWHADACTACSFALDRQGRFTRIELLGKGSATVVRPSAGLRRAVPCCELPFTLVGGMIVLREGITVDGVGGHFLLDTGCRTTLFNSASAHIAGRLSGRGVSQRTGVVSSGARSAGGLTTDSLVVGGNLFSFTGAASDLTALAAAVSLDDLTGILGCDLLRPFELHVDYARRVVRLYALDAEGRAAGAPVARRRIGFTLTRDYLPTFEVRCGAEPLRMLFDTGASGCCITPDCAARLGDRFRPLRTTRLRDTDASADVAAGRLAGLEWDRRRWRRMDAVVRDLRSIGVVDGILGYPAVARRHISINWVRCEFGIH